MLSISKLFGRSPFTPLQAHMNKVAECVEKLNDIFVAVRSGDTETVELLARKISKREHEADEIKREIRLSLRKGIFLPINRADLLEILILQDAIADRAEDIGVLLTLRQPEFLGCIEEDFYAFLAKNLEAFSGVRAVMHEFGELLNASFGGAEAEKVHQMIDDVAFQEHEGDLLQRKLLKHLFKEADSIPHWMFYLWLRIFDQVGSLADLSEKLAHRVRLTLELK